MSNVTIQDLLHRASEAITRNETWIYRVADNNGKMVSKVKRTREFLCDVADDLIATTRKWSHLQAEVNAYREGGLPL